MGQKRSRWLRFFIICLLVVVLPGCVEVRVNLEISRDGSGVASGTVAASMEMAGSDQMIAEIQKKLVAAGWSATPESSLPGKRALRIRRSFRNLAELSDLGLSGTFVATGGAWKKNYLTHLTFGGAGEAALFELTVDVPGDVVETNGTKISSSAVKWDLTGRQGMSELTIRSSGLSFGGPIELAKSLIRYVDVSLESASAKPVAVYSKDGFVWAVDAVRGGASSKVWEEPAESFTAAQTGLVALQVKSDDRLQGDFVLVSVSNPRKAVLRLERAGYEPTLAPDGSTLAFVRPTERFSSGEVAKLTQPEYTVSYIFISEPAGGVFEQMAAQEKLDTVKKAIERGDDFVALARQYSDDRESAQYASRSNAQPGGFRQGFGDSLAGHRKGDIFGPVKTAHGWYFLKVENIYQRNDLGTVPAKKTEIVVRDLSSQRERSVPFHPAMLKDLDNWNDHLSGWSTNGRGLRIVRTWFPPKESEIPSWLWIQGSDMVIDFAADVLADGRVVKTGDFGDFAGIWDPRTRKEQFVPDFRHDSSGGSFAISPSQSKLVFCIEQHKRTQLWVWTGTGEPILVDKGELEGQGYTISHVVWADEGHVLYTQDLGGSSVNSATLSPDSARQLTMEGGRPKPVPGGHGAFIYATGKRNAVQWWSGNLNSPGGPNKKILDGVSEVVAARTAGLAPGLRRAAGLAVVGLIVLLLGGVAAFCGVIIGRRVRRAVAAKAVARPVSQARFCRKCGAELRQGLKFCQKCGNPVM